MASGANQDDSAVVGPRASGRGLGTRAAVVGDASRVALINLRAWRDAYRGLVPDSYLEALHLETLQERWQKRIGEPSDRVTLVAELYGVVAAYCVGGRYRAQHDAAVEDTTGWGELYAIYAHPELRGRGAGRAVHDAMLGSLRTRGFTMAALWVLRDNHRSIAWYGARGWRPDGTVSQWLGSGVPLEEIRLTRPIRQPR